MLSAKVIGIELGDLPAALLLPICIGLCREFRQNFYALIQFKTPSKLRNTLASLNPRHSVSRIITPSPNLSGGIKKETYIQGSKRHLHQRLVNDRKLCQSETTRQIDPLCNYNMSKGDACDEASSERYIPDNRLHRQYEVQSETDGETAYDNTKSFHQCNSHHHQKDQHLQHTDATQLNKCSHRQNSPHIRPKRYEKLYDIRQHQQRLLPRYMYRSECDLHTSLPNSLFCSINHLSNQSYYHSKSGSFIHLQSKEDNISTNSLSLVNCDEIPIEVSKPILEHRSYV
ncbi:unnamed protein product [Trichobilharzia regenti]|nr:unnamed protein product [Trichobilharzia regenti]